MRRVWCAVLFLPILAAPADAQRRRPAPLPRVAIVTSEGTIVVALEAKRAPITTANFLHYVDAHRFDGTTFYRAARAKSDPRRGLIQGGVDHDMPKTFFAIKHEPTNVTGLRHVDGTLSMARNDPGTAMGDFFITIGPAAGLDASPRLSGLCRLRPCRERDGRGEADPRQADLAGRLFVRHDGADDPRPGEDHHDQAGGIDRPATPAKAGILSRSGGRGPTCGSPAKTLGPARSPT